MISSHEKREPLEPKVYAQGMAMLSAIFPALNLSPEVYYTFLEDLREDHFLHGVKKVCMEVTELYPNSNLVALIREKSENYAQDKVREIIKRTEKQITYQEPDYDQIEKVKTEWNDLKNRLAREKGAA